MDALRAALTAALLTAGVTAPRVLVAQAGDSTFVLGANALVDITVREGTLVVRGMSGSATGSTATVRSNGRNISIRGAGTGVVIDGSAAADRSRSAQTRDRRTRDPRMRDEAVVELSVPRGTRLVINAGRADSDVRDVDGDVQVRSSTGDIAMARIGGRVIIETLTGDITIDDGVGALRATSSSGDIVAHGVRDGVVVHTTSGDATVDGSGLSEAVIESISGDVSFDGGMVSNGRLRVSTHSGDVALRLPDGMRGVLEFSTHSGEMTTSMPLTTSGDVTGGAGQDRRAAQRFLLGGGGAAVISISTFSGDVRIERRFNRSPNR